MTIYYRDDHVQVTSEAVRAGERTLAITDLTYVWHTRGRPSARDRTRLLGRGALVLLLSLPPLVAVVCVLSLLYSAHDRGNWTLAGIVLAVCLVGALLLGPFLEVPLGWLDRSYDRGPGGAYELWVRYRGEEVMLVRTTDGLRFGQIYRAVQRAVEQHG